MELSSQSTLYDSGQIHYSSDSSQSFEFCYFKLTSFWDTMFVIMNTINDNSFISNSIILKNPENFYIFAAGHQSNVYNWKIELNCLYPYESSMYLFDEMHFLDSSNNEIKFEQAFYKECFHEEQNPETSFDLITTITTPSQKFSKSNFFTNSNTFSPSNKFSSSNKFSLSNTFSPSNIFSPSDDFGKTLVFTPTNTFSNSNKFTKTLMFSNSNYFTQTSYFSDSKSFKTKIFSNSLVFTYSFYFTKSKLLTQSNNFSDSEFFKPSPSQSTKGQIETISMTISMTYLKIKSVSYTFSFFSSINSFVYSPYIIYTYSPLYIPSQFSIIIRNKKKISPENLIGIVCGTVAGFFIILSIGIWIYKKKNYNYLENDSFISISESETETSSSVEVFNKLELSYSISNIDDWV